MPGAMFRFRQKNGKFVPLFLNFINLTQKDPEIPTDLLLINKIKFSFPLRHF